ncbi:unnamed protein product [Spirodela intermedia]|uniref:Peroxidase n=1 Tax=Spirodela intermedia TaxID=51605 RepID=A0A7I8IA65_SPIIN|nr:unnamed protein product [Spirodela intermedia]CAA6653932.1 unnamed protein product [Spirodela intermedia]
MMKWITVIVVLAVIPVMCSGDCLKIGFYDKTCPSAEKLVRKAVASVFASNPGIAPDSFACTSTIASAATPRCSSTPPGNPSEKDALPNLSLRGFEVIDAAKAAIEAACPDVVSCADILTFAARDSAALAGNISYQVPAGRRDGVVSNISEVNLPSPFANASDLIRRFAQKNLTPDELVTLSGAHSIGISHCGAFLNRIFRNAAASQVHAHTVANTTVRLDLITADVLDNKYYLGLENNLGLFTSDHALTTVAALKAAVEVNARNPAVWAEKFKRASVKMGRIEVLTGKEGRSGSSAASLTAAPVWPWNKLSLSLSLSLSRACNLYNSCTCTCTCIVLEEYSVVVEKVVFVK